MFSRPLEKTRGERADRRRQGVVGFLSPGPFRVIPEQDRRVVAEVLGDGVNRDVLIEDGGGMDATKKMNCVLPRRCMGFSKSIIFGDRCINDAVARTGVDTVTVARWTNTLG